MTAVSVAPERTKPRGWWLLVVLSLAIAGYAARYVIVGPAAVVPNLRESFSARPWGIYPHAFFGSIALALGPFQFHRGLLVRRHALHRRLGTVYVGAAFLVGLVGFYMAFYSLGGRTTHLGFGLLGAGLMLATSMAYLEIRRNRISSHREWMIRSFALLFSAVTLRIELPLLIGAFGGQFLVPYQIVSWLCWVPNILWATWFIHRSRSAGLPQSILAFRPVVASVIALAVLSEPARSQDHSHGPPKLGTVRFANSGAPGAQPAFQLGIALLHSFEYEDAINAFRDAQKADAKLALAYWGEALSYEHILWGQEDLTAARAALARLGPTPNDRLRRAGNARERSFGAAVEALLGSGSLEDRTRAYADSMRAYAMAAPNDIEATAFAAHAAMIAGYSTGGEDAARRFADATNFATKVFQASPDHPGGAHYLIHASDSPRFAKAGLDAARAYDKIAPDAEHALHMPSHIYLQLGLWDDVVASNERAWPASRAWVARNHASPAEVSWHTLEWLQYGYLQQGRYRSARALIDSARAILKGQRPSDDNPDAQFALAHLEFQYAVETGDWSNVPNDGVPPATRARAALGAPSPRARGMGLAAAHHGAVASILARRDTASAVATIGVLRAATGAQALTPVQLARIVIPIEALVARARGDTAGAIALLRQATSQEGDVSRATTAVGPPARLLGRELLGQLLLESGRYAEAVKAYEEALAQTPNRSPALLGLARAKAKAGDAAGSRAAYESLRVNWHRADPELLTRIQH
jgi:tetratricopeptide (TPR) repeat protein